ncbi:Glutamate--glyoxylate aminotransferase 1 [Hibiscus syriacus]|uniref:Glutamate--glyoxylate aminotransferase 1 n=1 Tax=Hibiscus syriacus TaxID=106335 RepID=A0A6A2ZSK7_HIBSY|nr:Glutamate--glyoxylate aminotransferase 1 [Hibiscus syriacus]
MGVKALDYESLNENVKEVQYAVRGELYLRASELQKEGKKIIFTNVGNPHALGQKPLTFPRQVIALCQAPFLLDDPNVLVPVPQYPLYSATISLYGGSLVPYYLEESANWGLDIIFVRAMVIINPGNPTGQCLSEANLREVLNFCHRENLVLLGDEVYQQNIYQDERPFISSRKVLMDMGQPISKEVQLVSFHTVSKGYWGECGQRGGYFEMTNIPPKTVDEIYKISSISLSPNVPAQIFVSKLSLLLTDGIDGQPQSWRHFIWQYVRERCHVFFFLKSVCLRKQSKHPKMQEKFQMFFYCLKLLEATGISTVPGSGFGQEGVFHLRTTIYRPRKPEIMSSFKKFNDEFMEQYEAVKI